MWSWTARRCLEGVPAGENVYALKVLNMDKRPHRYDLHPDGIPGLDLSADGPIEAEAARSSRSRCA